MVTRTTSVAVGLILVGLGGFAALSGEEGRDRSLKRQACERDHVGWESCRQAEADHIVPLCLARSRGEYSALDVLANIQLQPCSRWRTAKDGVRECVAGQAWHKDQQEREICADAKAGRLRHDDAVRFFSSGAWRAYLTCCED